jgi:outer membrane lipoprotein carrier protein
MQRYCGSLFNQGSSIKETAASNQRSEPEYLRRLSSCYTLGVKSKVRFAIVVLLEIAISSALLSGAKVFADESAVSAKQVAHLLEEHYRHLKTLRATFLERYSEGPKQSRVESGTVSFLRPGQMRWEYESPEKKLFLVDGKTAWFYVPYDHTVTKAPVKESSDWRTPLALLTGKADLSRLCSQIDLTSQSGIPANHALLRCVPREAARDAKEPSEGKEYTEVLLEVDVSSGELARIEIRQPGGIELEYRFADWQSDIPLPGSLFRFQIPAGVAVVDGATLPESPR